MRAALLVFGISTLFGLAGAGFFVMKNQALQAERTTLNNSVVSLNSEKTQLEKDLIFYKNTDFVKDNELLKLKLQNTESDLAAAQQRVETLETSLNKIRPHLDAVSAIEKFLGAPFTQSGLDDINAKVSALRDEQVTYQWMTAKNTIDFANNGWGPHDFFQVVFLLNTKIRSLLP